MLSSSPSVERLASVPLSNSSDLTKVPVLDSISNWHTEFDAMHLPSFKPAFFFLCRIPLDVLHECLRLWLEQRPKTEPSLLCVRQVLIDFDNNVSISFELHQFIVIADDGYLPAWSSL